MRGITGSGFTVRYTNKIHWEKSIGLRKNKFGYLPRLILFIFCTLARPISVRAAPRITGITPDHGPRGLKTDITITGSGFSSDSRVVIWGGGTYIKGSLPTIGSANSLYCTGDYAYVACGLEGESNGCGVQIFDIKDPNATSSLAFFPLSQKVNDIFVFEGYAYLASTKAGLQVLDVHNPHLPSLISSVPLLPGKAMKISVYGTHIYVAADTGGLQVIDISNPHQAMAAGSCLLPENGYALDVVAEGGYAYLAAGWGGIKIVNIADSQNPQIVSTFSRPDRFVAEVYKHQNYLYLSEMEYGVEILDVSNPVSPVLVSHFTTPGLAHKVSIKGNYLYIADDYCGIGIFSHHPLNSTMVGFQPTPGWALDLQVFGDHILVADAHGGLQILDAQNPSNPSIASIVDLMDSSVGTQVNGLHLQGDYAYVYSKSYSYEQNWLKILDISDPKAPWVCGSTSNIGRKPDDLLVSQDYAYLVDEDDGLQILNVTYKQSPQRVSFYDTDTSGGKGIFKQDNKLFLADSVASGRSALKIFSQDIKRPSLLGKSNLSSQEACAESVYISGNYGIVAGGSAGIEIFDIHLAGQPSSLATYSLSGYIKDVLISGAFAYLANEDGAVEVIDIGIPSSPSLVSFSETEGEPRSLSLAGNYMHVAEGGTGLRIVDVIDPENPLTLASMLTLTPAEEVIAVEDYIYVAIENGLMVVHALRPCIVNSCLNGSTLDVYTPIGLVSGTYNVTVIDPNGYMAVLPNGFTVEDNRSPIMEKISDNAVVSVYQGQDLTFTLMANDPDGDPLTYSASLSKLPAGASLHENIFSWTPDFEDIGIYPDIQFTVSDGEFVVSQEVIIFVIEDVNVNHSPALSLPSSVEGREGMAVIFTIEASDQDQNHAKNLDISMINAPAGADIKTLTFQQNKIIFCFFWNPTCQQAGTYPITFVVKDPSFAESQKTVSIKINDVTGSSLTVNLQAGLNWWLSPEGGGNYTSFDFLKEHGEEAVSYLKVYDWDQTLLYNSFWIFGQPGGDDFPMNQSQLYVIYSKKDISFTWPQNF